MRILIVEDDPMASDILQHALETVGHDVRTAANGRQAIEILRESSCAVVISDWEMPEMNGLDLCQAVRSESFGRYIYVILLTAREGRHNRIQGLAAGADEFMSKPLEPEELTVRLQTAERIISLETRDLAIFAMAKLAESRDPETGTHLERVRAYSHALALALTKSEYAARIDAKFIQLLYQTSPLHDIGKVAIPDHVLLKTGRQDDEEHEIMKTHAAQGAKTLEFAILQYPDIGFLRMARDIAACHHERFDGKGYPAGLRELEIPLAARIFSVADVYDALISKRVYKEAFTHSVARNIIAKGSGTQFDPVVVQAFLRCEGEFQKIAHKFVEVGSDQAMPSSA